MNIHDTLRSVLIAHDKREARGNRYNPHALALYMEALQSVDEEVSKGVDIKIALELHFCGRLLEKLLKAIS